MLIKADKAKIRALIQSPQWGAIEDLANQLCDKLKDDSAVRDSEWETLSALLTREGEIRGIKRFIQEIYLTQNE